MSEKKSVKVKDDVTARKRLIDQEVQNKVYYDVSIKYNPEEVDNMYGFYSKAETEIHLSSAIVDDPLNYDLAISKFKIDTECLPIMIPEMSIPGNYDANTMEVQTEYKIWVHYPVEDDTKGTEGINKFFYVMENAKDNDNKIHHPMTHNDNATYTNTKDIYNISYSCYGPTRVTMIPNCGCPPNVNTTAPGAIKTSFNSNFNRVRGVKTVGDVTTYPEYCVNTDQSYFIYDYQSFLDRINIAIENIVSDVYRTKIMNMDINGLAYKPDERICVRPVIFKAENGSITMYINEEMLKSHIMLRFSGNLYKYIGMGFKCKFYYSKLDQPLGGVPKENGTFFIDYDSFAFSGNNSTTIESYVGAPLLRYGIKNDKKYEYGHVMPQGLKSINDFTGNVSYLQYNMHGITVQEQYDKTALPKAKKSDLFPTNVSSIIKLNQLSNDDERSTLMYFSIKQQFTSLPNWNVCKGIIISSSFLPIKGEYYPTANNDGFLTHYSTEEYREAQKNLGLSGGEKAESQAVFNKQSMKVVEVYYPMSATAGDIRSCIIYDNTNIENGNKIDLQGGVDLDHFDIKVKWVDIYGNIYPLYLAPGCNVNIRFCLTRKKLRRDDLIEGFNTVSELLSKIANAAISSDDDKNHTFDVGLEPKRKRGKVELPGVLENGLIIKS